MQSGTDMVVLDSRPFDEYSRVSIPTGVNVPGAELVLRVHDIAPKPDTLVVVNCAGRTRSIIGAQSLINAGVPNKVVALRNGTMGWNLAGFTPDSGKSQRAPDVVAWRARLGEIRRRGGRRQARHPQHRRGGARAAARRRDPHALSVRRARSGRIRRRPCGGRALGAGRAAGAGDGPICRNAASRASSCVDDKQVRAVMTASWLAQMGWREVFVLVASGDEKGFPDNPVLGEAPRDAAIAPAALADLLARGEATVVDLSLSRDYAQAHIPGAWFAIRARLGEALGKIKPRGTLVLTSEDGVLAGLAVADARALASLPVAYLDGGNAAWRAAGLPLTKDDPRMADEPVDAWLKPYERPDGVKQAMADYLAWETDLLPRIARDGCARLRIFGDSPRPAAQYDACLDRCRIGKRAVTSPEEFLTAAMRTLTSARSLLTSQPSHRDIRATSRDLDAARARQISSTKYQG